MDEQRAQRTLVKSPPELWAEISDVDALARHLGEFGEISITRTEPETAVAWEGDRARGTVELEPAGWGTKVTLTAVPVGRLAAAAEAVGAEPYPAEPEPEPEAGVEAEPEPPATEFDAEDATAPEPEPDAEPELTRRSLWARFAALWRGPSHEQAAPEATPHDDERAPSPPEEPRDAEATTPAAPAPVTPVAGAADPARTAAILVEVLDDLGAARHRPFSRMG
jgi:hypothetical protein